MESNRDPQRKADPAADAKAVWYVVMTKPKQEPLALANLERQGFECYAPRFLQEKILRKKRVVVDLPLFPRYLFIRPLRGGEAPLYPVRSTFGVSHLVTFGPGKRPGTVDASPIEALLMEEARRRASDIPEAFTKGDPVRILEGPFLGLLGVFDLRDDQERVHVLIDFLGKATRLALPIHALEKDAP